MSARATRPSSGRRLSALVVNYNSGGYALRCVESLHAEWKRSGRDARQLEVIVVDNCSPTDQNEWLAALERSGARVLRSPDNGGYAKGVNLAYAHSSGTGSDVVGILNPDLHFLPGSVDALLDYLAEHPECGAIDPRAWVDPERELALPRNTLPTPFDQIGSVLAQMSPRACRAYSRRRLRNALPWWTSSGPIEADMLSGCCLFLRREVVARLPALMDERYPLYFEDTDLFSSLRRLGYTLVHHSGAPVLHHWSRSAGVGGAFAGEPLRRFLIGQRAYFRKFHGRMGEWVVRATHWVANRWPRERSFRPMHPLVDLGSWSRPFELELPRSCNYLLEFGMSPTWLLAVGVTGSGRRWVCPPRTWEWFFQGQYFVRALDSDTGELLGAWCFHKSEPGRESPLELCEAAQSAPAAALHGRLEEAS